MTNVLVSIITPVHNSEKFIYECIQSVKAQSFQDYEHIIIDDASNDDSKKIIFDQKREDERIKYIQLKQNSGAGFARNKAIELAKGKFIAFLDADDFWHPEKLRKQVEFIRNGGYAFTYSWYHVTNESGEPLYKVQSPKKLSYNDLLKNCYIGCLTVMYDQTKLGKMYMPLIRKRQDWALWLSILRKTDYAYGIEEPLAFYRLSDNSLSRNKVRLLKYNYAIYHEFLKYNRLTSFMMMLRFLIYYFHFKAFGYTKIGNS